MRRATAGFTLIELMVVIVVIGVLASMVRLSVGDNIPRQARQEATLLIRLMQDLRERAVLEGQEYGLRLEPQAYQVMRFDTERWREADRRVRLPQGLALGLTLEGRAQSLITPATSPQLLWLSSDENTAFSVHVDSPSRRWVSISSDGFGEPVLDE